MPAALLRDGPPYPLPPVGAPLRVAFLGPAATAGVHALHVPAPGLQPFFVDVRAAARREWIRSALAHVAPHVVVVLAPELVPPGTLERVRAATLAVGPPDAASGAFDRLMTSGEKTSAAGVWRSRPIPIDDRLYADVRPSHHPPRALFLGSSSEHREAMLIDAKHAYDVVHYAHGLSGEALVEVLAAADVGIALRRTPVPDFPRQMYLHLAAGHLLLAERPAATHGLEPGIDYLQFDSVDEFLRLLYQLKLRPDAYNRVRVRGRLKAEEHRASRVWPRLIADLLVDLVAFGTDRELRIP